MIPIHRDTLTDGRLSEKQIRNAMNILAFRNAGNAVIDDYYLGKNRTILKSNHNHRIPVPYGRKLIKSVLGFMFKEGCITYKYPDSDNEFKEAIEGIFSCNDEETENIRVARDQAKYGSGYEALYIDNDDAHPQFYRIPASQMIAIYDYSTKPRMIAALNVYKTGLNSQAIEVYYKDRIEKLEDNGHTMTCTASIPHMFGDVPIIEYRNNEEGMGDIESILSIIDASDDILSNGIDEDSKYSDAVMLMKNVSLDDDAIDKLSRLRVLEMDEDSEVQYLTKPSTYEGREILRKVLEGLIYSMSGIPNLDDKDSMAQQSGEALKYLYATFEVMVAGDKESGFKDGLMKRLRLITNFQNWLHGTSYRIDGITISMTRNLPAESTVIIDNTTKLSSVISKKSQLENVKKAGYITDVDEEMQRLDEETSIEATPTGEDDIDAF